MGIFTPKAARCAGTPCGCSTAPKETSRVVKWSSVTGINPPRSPALK